MIATGAGVIDADYRGIVFALLFNHSDEDLKVEKGDQVAQLILEKIATPKVEQVKDLDKTTRRTKNSAPLVDIKKRKKMS